MLEAGNFEAHYNLAWLTARENRLADGVEHLKKAVAARPRDAAARNALGGLYLRLGKLPEAEAELAEAGRLDPKSPWAPYNLALVRDKRGDRPGAIAQFRRALQVDPSFAPARSALAKLAEAK